MTMIPTSTMNDPMNYVYGVLCLVCFLLGTILNSFSLYYFLRKPRHLSTLVYLAITSTDTMICLLAGPVSLAYLTQRDPGVMRSTVVCQAWGVLWNAFARMSVFLVAVLSISRTVSLRYPFKRVSKRLIVGLIVGYGVVQVTQSSIPYWYGVLYKYYATHLQCQWFYDDVPLFDNSIPRACYSGLMWLELALPILPIIASCLISICELRKQSSPGSASKRAVTQTVIIFTINYIVLNIPYFIYFILAHVNRFSGYKYTYLDFDEPSHNFRSFVVMISVIMNSAGNPMVYLFRFQRFREFVVKVIKNQHRSIVFNSSNTDGTSRRFSEALAKRFSITPAKFEGQNLEPRRFSSSCSSAVKYSPTSFRSVIIVNEMAGTPTSLRSVVVNEEEAQDVSISC